MLQRYALRKFHVIQSQNARDQMAITTSDRKSERMLATHMPRMRNSNLEISIADSSNLVPRGEGDR